MIRRHHQSHFRDGREFHQTDGRVVKAAKAALEGKAVDGKALSDLVRDRISRLAKISRNFFPSSPDSSCSDFNYVRPPGNHRGALHGRKTPVYVTVRPWFDRYFAWPNSWIWFWHHGKK